MKKLMILLLVLVLVFAVAAPALAVGIPGVHGVDPVEFGGVVRGIARGGPAVIFEVIGAHFGL